MQILPTGFSIVEVWQGINSFLTNMSPLIIFLATLILGPFIIETVIGFVKKIRS